MPDEDWRDEIQEYARLLDAVASGDRSRVVKHLTDYILGGKKEGNASSQAGDDDHDRDHDHGEDHKTPGEQEQYPEQEEDNGYEYYEEDAYNESYAAGTEHAEENKEHEYEEDQYEYGNGYDDEYPAEYDPSTAAEDYYEEPYMSGAYNEPDNGDETYEGEEYTEYNGDDPSSYGNETYTTGEAENTDASSYPRAAYNGPNSNNYGNHQYPESQEYGDEYYDQEYNDWDPGAENYHYHQGTDGAGGEWHEEPDYGLVSDDQNQEVVDEVALYDLDDEYLDEDPDHAHDDYADLDEHDYLDEHEHEDLDHYADMDEHGYWEEHDGADLDHYADLEEEHGHLQEHEEHQEHQDPEKSKPLEDLAYPDDDDQLPNYEEQTQLRHHPEDNLFFLPPPPNDALPGYSEIPRYAANQSPKTQYVPYRPPPSILDEEPTEKDRERGEDGIPSMRRAGTTTFSPRTSTDRVGSGKEDEEEEEWEDETCEDEDESLPPPPPLSPRHPDIQFNPLSQQYKGGLAAEQKPDPFLYIPTIGSGQASAFWER
ncbi:hypothetical protein Z517_08954 [Fonsecaea pedrosoi CBS 271.37]|uniref:Uncharacterized protein n=1 Tax=Fonsecaea pedrosoi CBS 271.37 TaxID=1442368 RepID=A0A0D2H3C4_9EURO|nr:uncharacterized protein Z517_08954 [Fonsecaea pedrosoi CBS 271.37]KIW79114.1 hypothetical protein Z517_08954 [Fonsecaea pedrosoi CBS 271.37]